MHEGQAKVVRIEGRQDIGHGGEDRQTCPPTCCPIGNPEGHAGPQGGGRTLARTQHLDETEHGLGRDQRQALLQAFLEPAEMVGGGVGDRTKDHDHVVTVDLDVVGPYVVGEGVEGPTGCQVEAGMVPVTRQEPVLDRAPVQREAHVRAPVVDGVGLSVGIEDAHRLGADLSRQTASLLQLLDGPDPRSLCCHASLTSLCCASRPSGLRPTLRAQLQLRSRGRPQPPRRSRSSASWSGIYPMAW